MYVKTRIVKPLFFEAIGSGFYFALLGYALFKRVELSQMLTLHFLFPDCTEVPLALKQR